jgi:hypothetical protein
LKNWIRNLTIEDLEARFDIFDAFQNFYFSWKSPSKGVKTNGCLIYHLWKHHKSLETPESLKNHLSNNFSLITSMRSKLSHSPNIYFEVFRSQIQLDSLSLDCKKEQDSESFTTEGKIFSDTQPARPGSIIGKLGGLFTSKSVKSSDSGSSSRPKLAVSDHFSEVLTRFRSCFNFLHSVKPEFLEVTKEGFPAPLRGSIWQKLLDLPAGYSHLYDFLKDSRKIEMNKQISLDIPRCHKNNLLLISTLGKSRLETILKIWILHNNGIRYSQGLDSIAGICVILYEDDEAAAFFSFKSIISKYLLPILIHEDLVGNFLLILRNLVSFLDPVLANHLHSNHINPEMYATSWLLTLYSRIDYLDNFPLASVLVLWDLLLQKPPEMVFIVAFAILQQFREDLLENEQNEIIGFLAGINMKIDLEKCISESLSYFDDVPLGVCRLSFPKDGQAEWEKEVSVDLAQATRSPLINMKDCEMIKGEYLIVDTRPVEDYKVFMISGSINLPVKIGSNQGVLPSIKLTHAQLQGLKEHGKGKTIILVGDSTLTAHSVSDK